MDSSETIARLLESALNDITATPMAYRVKSGDTLSQIIAAFYDTHYDQPQYAFAQASVLYFNPQISDPNHIAPGQVLRLMPLPHHSKLASCTVPDDFHKDRRVGKATRHRLEPQYSGAFDRLQHSIPALGPEEEAFWALAWLQENYDILSTSAGSGINAFGGLVGQSNNAFIAEVKMLYNQKQQGILTSSQYQRARQKALAKYAAKIGPFEKILFKGKTATEAIRISRTKALPATAKIDSHLGRLTTIANNLKYGGHILTAAGLGMGCYNIAQTPSWHEKNEIFVETLLSTAVGVGTGIALTVYFIATPTGWVTALALGIGAAVASLAAGKSAKYVYNMSNERIDLVTGSGIYKLCQ